MVKKRRTRTKHPGVKLVRVRQRNGKVSHVARWKDPDTGKSEQASLDKLGLKNDEGRTEWAIRKHEALVARRREQSLGAPKKTETPLTDAVNDYFKGARLKARTEKTYRRGIATFKHWVESRGVRLVEQITPAHLGQFKATLVSAQRLEPLGGGNRGERRNSVKKRSANTINSLLRPVATFLGHLRRLGFTPLLTGDHIADCLKQLPTPKPKCEFLKVNDLKKLIGSALRHDAANYKLTRDENRSGRAGGTTPRYEPISPFIALALLTGMRFSEAVGLEWTSVDLDARDEHGHPSGEIALSHEQVKTSHARTVDLIVAPRLRRLLSALKLRAGERKLVFHNLSRSQVEAARKRLVREFGAPRFSWQTLRRTCGTFLTNAHGIFGAASAYRSAKQLGHSVVIAEKHYLGVLRGISRDARTLDDAMEIADLLDKIVERALGGVDAEDTAATA